jgi:two-component system nitrogen regulation sensor histidine kinase NtrY
MGFSRFYFLITVRVVLIVLSGLLFSFFVREDDKNMINLVLVLLLIIQTYLLIKYINKTNTELARFIIRMQAKDTAINYPEGYKKPGSLHFSLNMINKEMQEMRIENEQQSHYINAIINNLNVGVIAFDDSGKVELLNPAACRMFNCKKFYFLNKLKADHFEFHQAIMDAVKLPQHLKKIHTNDGPMSLAFRSKLIKIGKRNIHVLSFQNIGQELDRNELDSWHKLIRVLNHEIMNSITPITTLSKTIQRYIHHDDKLKKAAELNDEIIKDIAINSDIITERGKGLIDFIEVYKNITTSPELNLTTFKIAPTIDGIQKFFRERFDDQGVKFESTISEDLQINADESLLKQMLINLVKNSLEALGCITDPFIHIKAHLSAENNPIIRIEDNGAGIPEDEQDKIFIPFYSTKENGSGIGLSLCRQIMHLHQGSISVKSEPGIKTIFILMF